LGGVDRALAVKRHAERADHAADQRRTDGHRHDLAGATHLVAFLDALVLAEENATDVVLFEIESETGDVVRERDELTGHDPIEAVDAGDAVADGDDRADFGDVDAAADAA